MLPCRVFHFLLLLLLFSVIVAFTASVDTFLPAISGPPPAFAPPPPDRFIYFYWLLCDSWQGGGVRWNLPASLRLMPARDLLNFLTSSATRVEASPPQSNRLFPGRRLTLPVDGAISVTFRSMEDVLAVFSGSTLSFLSIYLYPPPPPPPHSHLPLPEALKPASGIFANFPAGSVAKMAIRIATRDPKETTRKSKINTHTNIYIYIYQ